MTAEENLIGTRCLEFRMTPPLPINQRVVGASDRRILVPVPKMCPKTRRSFEAEAKELQAAKADVEDMKAARVPKFVAFLAKYGYVDLA